MTFQELTQQRYSLRKFSNKPVEDEKLQLVLEAGDGKNHGEIDASLATMQMMLQAADLGLGTTYVGMFEPEKLLAAFPEMQGLIPIALLPLGYPAEGAHPSRLHTQRKELSDLVQTL